MEGALKWRGGKSGQRYFQQREGRAGVVVVSLTRRAKSEEYVRKAWMKPDRIFAFLGQALFSVKDPCLGSNQRVNVGEEL